MSDQDTICNLTNHTYFNLDGFQAPPVLDQTIQIFADTYTWADSESLPDGRILDVAGTPMDLRQPTRIGAHIDDDFDELQMGLGYDHNWVLSAAPDARRDADPCRGPQPARPPRGPGPGWQGKGLPRFLPQGLPLRPGPALARRLPAAAAPAGQGGCGSQTTTSRRRRRR